MKTFNGRKFYYLGSAKFSFVNNKFSDTAPDAKFYYWIDEEYTDDGEKREGCFAIKDENSYDFSNIAVALARFNKLGVNEESFDDIETLKQDNKSLKERINILENFFNGMESTTSNFDDDEDLPF